MAKLFGFGTCAAAAALCASLALAQEAPTIFDSPRGHGYNPFATVGAASNVRDIAEKPSDILGNKFAYISPSDKLGYAAFDAIGGSALLGLANSEPQLAALILGYATPAFGVALEMSVWKKWVSVETDGMTETDRFTNPGDNFGLYFSLPLGFAKVYYNVNWLTYRLSHFNEVKGSPAGGNGEQKVSYSMIDANAGLLGSIGSLSYDVCANIVRAGGAYHTSFGDNSYDDKAIDDDTFLLAALNLNIGYAALKSQTARVIAGLNNSFGIFYLDRIGDDIKSDDVKVLSLTPNILSEVVLFENLLAFAGAAHDIVFAFGDGDRIKRTSRTEIWHSYETEAFAGLRYQRANWAMEAQVSANPFEVFSGKNIFAGFGGFVYF